MYVLYLYLPIYPLATEISTNRSSRDKASINDRSENSDYQSNYISKNYIASQTIDSYFWNSLQNQDYIFPKSAKLQRDKTAWKKNYVSTSNIKYGKSTSQKGIYL